MKPLLSGHPFAVPMRALLLFLPLLSGVKFNRLKLVDGNVNGEFLELPM